MEKLGVCGDDCSICPRYIATQQGDAETLRQAADLWKRAGWRDEVGSPKEMICSGCASVKWCRYDDIRDCAQTKEISNCGECDMYPCDKISTVFERTRSYAKQCKDSCSKEDYECLHKAFFSKKSRLDQIHALRFR